MMSDSRNMQFLGPVDSAFWYLDSRKTPMNIGSILIFEGQIDFEDIVDLIESRIHQMPLYQQKVIQPNPAINEPVWVYDEDFYIENHIFQRTLRAPFTKENLQKTVARIISRKLNRSKPLWELHVITGLADDRTALLFKVHHCMVDGVSAIGLFSLIMDISSDMPIIEAGEIYDPPKQLADDELRTELLLKGFPHRFKLLQELGTNLLNLGMNFIDHNQRRETVKGMVSLVSDMITPINPLAINGDNSGKLSVAWSDFAMKDVLKIRQAQRCSVNDVMLAVLGTAIGRYQAEFSDEITQDFVRVIIPVNMRNESVPTEDVGNRISMLPIEIPLYSVDVLECLDAVSAYTRTMKNSELSKGFDMALTLPAFAISALQPVIWDIVPRVFASFAHTWCTNVAGPPTPMYLLGHELQHAYGFLPINPSMGLASTILSYDGKMSINLLTDDNIVKDVRLLASYIDEAYAELLDMLDLEASEIPLVHEVVQPKLMEKEDPIFSINSEGEMSVEQVLAEAEATVKTKTKVKILSKEWSQDLYEAINNSKAYYRASTRWTKGAIAIVVQGKPDSDFPTTEAVLVDLYRGKCQAVSNLPVEEAKSRAKFVLDGSYDDWMAVLDGQVQAIPMIVRGKLKLSKGMMLQLMPFTRSSEELVKCAMQVTQ